MSGKKFTAEEKERSLQQKRESRLHGYAQKER